MGKEKIFIQILEMIIQYKLSPTHHQNILVALNYNSEEWLKKVNKIVVGNNFQVIGRVKNTTELI
jgi:hypothetical protein